MIGSVAVGAGFSYHGVLRYFSFTNTRAQGLDLISFDHFLNANNAANQNI